MHQQQRRLLILFLRSSVLLVEEVRGSIASRDGVPHQVPVEAPVAGLPLEVCMQVRLCWEVSTGLIVCPAHPHT